MIARLDRILGSVTMYLLVIIALAILGVAALVGSLIGQVSYPVPDILLSAAVLLIATLGSNRLIGLLLRVRPQTASSVITALLLVFIFAPTHDPACEQYGIVNDRNQSGALSYKWQYHCPNDQNLIAIIGREPGTADPPQPPLEDRHRIPDNGPCIRCNLQVEGSGASPDDVVIDGGRVESGDSGPSQPAKDEGQNGLTGKNRMNSLA